MTRRSLYPLHFANQSMKSGRSVRKAEVATRPRNFTEAATRCIRAAIVGPAWSVHLQRKKTRRARDIFLHYRLHLPLSKAANMTDSTMWDRIAMVLQFVLLPFTMLSLTPTAFVLGMLSLGPCPRHVAFIMDGNRRWVKSLNLRGQVVRTPIYGHQSGFQALKRVLDLCLQLGGVEHVTVYAFAIDNFKRKKDEVDELMGLARQSLLELAGHGELLARHKARIKVVGRVDMLPRDVQDAVTRIQDMTKANAGPTLNICIPYSSRDEMAAAVQARVKSHVLSSEKGAVPRDEREVQKLNKEMMLAHSPPVDLLIRTSGVERLSDFMLWQITPKTLLYFVPTFWPVFGLRDLLPILLQWQAHQFRRWLWDQCGYEHTEHHRAVA